MIPKIIKILKTITKNRDMAKKIKIILFNHNKSKEFRKEIKSFIHN